MKKIIKAVFNKFGLEIMKKSAVENAFELQEKLIKNTGKPITIFDVGAHIGAISLKYNGLFPNSTI
jgi:phenylalanyl-tRNA synthetase beta subunit